MKKILFLLLACLSFACNRNRPKKVLVEDANFKKAEALFAKQNDSAFFYFTQTASTSRDSMIIAMSYNYMAVIQSDAGDYFGSQESLLASLKFLTDKTEQARTCLASDYNELGLTSIKLKQYEPAITYFDRALNYSQTKKFSLAILNNKALAYLEKGDYSLAIRLYQRVLPQTARKQTYARILTNLARAKWLARPTYDAAPELLAALAIRQQENDTWGLNSSYAHLAEFYTRSKPDSALYYATSMYQVARQLNSPDDQLEALENLIKVGPVQATKHYFTLYHHLNDSLQTARNAAKNQFALIRYEVQKNKADNLKLQKDNADKKYQLAIKNGIIFCVIALFVVTTIMLSYRHRKKKQQAVQDNQLRLTTKVHNRLANGIYQLIQEIDNHEGYDKEMVAQELTILYERSRDISHEPSHLTEIDFTEKIDRLLTAFAGQGINLAIVGNEIEYWENVNDTLKSELEQVLQEWMVNMKKHSQATSVSIQFSRTEHQLKIVYTDNGIGLPADTTDGKGLQFTGNRIKKLGGSINFDTQWKQGTRIQLTLPLT